MIIIIIDYYDDSDSKNYKMNDYNINNSYSFYHVIFNIINIIIAIHNPSNDDK